MENRKIQVIAFAENFDKLNDLITRQYIRCSRVVTQVVKDPHSERYMVIFQE